MIGRKFSDKDVQDDMKHWSFKVVDDNTKPKIQVEYKGETKTFFPEEVSDDSWFWNVTELGSCKTLMFRPVFKAHLVKFF